jgi:hypothetical protein
LADEADPFPFFPTQQVPGDSPRAMGEIFIPIRNQQAFFVGANLVFAPNVQGEHKVRPYKKLSFDCKLVSGMAIFYFLLPQVIYFYCPA